jgi:hypothetical protein
MQSRHDMGLREPHDNYFVAVLKTQEILARPLMTQLAVVPPLNIGGKGCGGSAE